MKRSRTALWQQSSMQVLTSDVVARRDVGPAPPREWRATCRQLIEASRAPELGPRWWTPGNAYFGSVETRTDPKGYVWDGMERLGKKDHPLFFFQFTLAGFGVFETKGRPVERIAPGRAFFAVVPSEHHYFLPPDSPGWTFAWLGVYHPYLLGRVASQVSRSGAVLPVEPQSALIAKALRLVRGAFHKDFRDKFEVELALFDFVLTYERLAHSQSDPHGEGERLLEAVRKRMLADLETPIGVDALAREHGMSRSHFSHFFRERTGLTPGRFLTETRIREAARLLVQTRTPVKQVANACGFSNVNHFSKVFRRYQHLSPAAYREAMH